MPQSLLYTHIEAGLTRGQRKRGSWLKHFPCSCHGLVAHAMGLKSFSAQAPGFLGTGLMTKCFHDLRTVKVSSKCWNHLLKTPLTLRRAMLATTAPSVNSIGGVMGILQHNFSHYLPSSAPGPPIWALKPSACLILSVQIFIYILSNQHPSIDIDYTMVWLGNK